MIRPDVGFDRRPDEVLLGSFVLKSDIAYKVTEGLARGIWRIRHIRWGLIGQIQSADKAH